MLLLSHQGIIRAGLKHILSQAPVRSQTGDAEDAGRARQELLERPWDVVIVDLSDEQEHRLDLIRQSARQLDGPVTLIITPFSGEDPHLKRGLQAGAAGCVHWDELDAGLLKAMEWIDRGHRYVDPKLGAALLGNERAEGSPHERLSDREFQVLSLLAKGMRTGEIAEQMMLSPKTISTYRNRIERKTHLRTNADFVQYGWKHGLMQA